MNRRTFLGASLLGVGAALRARTATANDRVIMGVIGINDSGWDQAQLIADIVAAIDASAKDTN